MPLRLELFKHRIGWGEHDLQELWHQLAQHFLGKIGPIFDIAYFVFGVKSFAAKPPFATFRASTPGLLKLQPSELESQAGFFTLILMLAATRSWQPRVILGACFRRSSMFWPCGARPTGI